MLVIRLQRLGRKAYPVYRIVVQDSRRHPSSGKVVAYIGHYNPHTKEAKLDKEQVERYLNNGAQPSDRVIKLLKDNSIKLPKWVKEPIKKERSIKNPDKLRKNQPAEEAPAEEVAETQETEAPAEEPEKAEESKEEAATEEKNEETAS